MGYDTGVGGRGGGVRGGRGRGGGARGGEFVHTIGYITPAFSGSPWWGEISLERSGCGGNEQKACEKGWKRVKLGENPKMPHPHCGRSIKTCCQTTNDAQNITKYGFLVRPNAQMRLMPPLCLSKSE